MSTYSSGGFYNSQAMEEFARMFAEANFADFRRLTCDHSDLGIACDTEHQELQVHCNICRSAIGIPRGWVAKDEDGTLTKKLVAYAFGFTGDFWKEIMFPWEVIYNHMRQNKSLVIVGQNAITRFSEVGGLLKVKFGLWLMWLWLYCCCWSPNCGSDVVVSEGV